MGGTSAFDLTTGLSGLGLTHISRLLEGQAKHGRFSRQIKKSGICLDKTLVQRDEQLTV